MFRLLLLMLALAANLAAQCPSSCVTTVDESNIHLSCETDTPGTSSEFKVAYNTTTTLSRETDSPTAGNGWTVSGATNASPIVITTSAAHGLSTGKKVTISGVLGNTAANVIGNAVTVLTTTTFSLDGTTGNGAYTSGGTGGISTRWQNISDVNPNQKVYLDFRASDAAGSYGSRTYSDCQTELCPSGVGAQPGGYSCEDADGGGPGTDLIPYVTTAADDGDGTIEPPAAPVHARTLAQVRTSPTTTGSTTDVTVDGSGNCTNFQAILNDHGDAGTKDTSLNHVIRIPNGSFCKPEDESGGPYGNYDIPAKTGVGTVTIKCVTEQVPAGTRHTPGMQNPDSCGLQLNTSYIGTRGPFQPGGYMIQPWSGCTADECTEGWRFEGIIFDASRWQDQTLRRVGVSAVNTGTGHITTSGSVDGIVSTFTPTNLSLPGITGSNATLSFYYGLQNRGNEITRRNSTTDLDWNLSSATAWDGTYSGGGYVYGGPILLEISSCTAASDTVCTFTESFGMADYEPLSITGGITSGVLTVDAGHEITGDADIYITGSAACADGVYGVTTADATTITIDGCSGTGSGGTFQRILHARFFAATGTGASELEGVHNVLFPSATTVKVMGVDLTGQTITYAGFEYGGSGRVYGLVSFYRMKRTTCDRCFFKASPYMRTFSGVGMGVSDTTNTNDVAIVDSTFADFQFWMAISSRTNPTVDYVQTYSKGSAAPRLIQANTARDVWFAGITIYDSPSFGFFSDGPFVPYSLQDISFIDWKMIFSDRWLNGVGAPYRIAYNHRGHAIEMKSGYRIEMDGVLVHNSPNIGTSNPPVIYFSYWTDNSNPGRRMEDLNLSNIWTKSNSGGISWVHQTVDGRRLNEWWPISRIRIDNWLHDGQPYPSKSGSPHGDFLQYDGSYFSAGASAGGALFMGGPMRDVRLTRLTWRRLQNSGSWAPAFVSAGRPGSGFQVEDSIIGQSGAYSFFTYDFSTNQNVPAVTADGESGFNQMFTNVGGADARSWMGKVGTEIGVIPCLVSSNEASPNYTATNSAYTTASGSTTAWGCTSCTNWETIIIGADAQSCATREAAGFNSSLDGAGSLAGLGANTAELYAALGYGVEANITDAVSGVTIGYTVPAGTGVCTVDYSTSATFNTYTRATDSGTGTSRSATGPDPSGGPVYYRIMCAEKEAVWGSYE